MKLQWLPLLACWLTSPSPPSYADLELTAAGQHSSDPPSPRAAPASGAVTKAGPESYSVSTPASPGKGFTGALNEAQAAAEEGAAKGRSEDRQQAARAVPEMSLDQHAEQAFQLQEAAMRVGYAAAALPLWEHFLWRFFSHQVLLTCQ